jgi:hypothetical protein
LIRSSEGHANNGSCHSLDFLRLKSNRSSQLDIGLRSIFRQEKHRVHQIGPLSQKDVEHSSRKSKRRRSVIRSVRPLIPSSLYKAEWLNKSELFFISRRQSVIPFSCLSVQDSASRPSMRFLSSREASGEPELSLSRFATPRPDRALVSQFLFPAISVFLAHQPHEKEELTF